MNETAQHSIEAITIGFGNKATVVGGTTAVLTGVADKAGVLTTITTGGNLDIAGTCALGGLLLAIIGYATSLYFQIRRERREIAEFNFRIHQAAEDETAG